MDDHRRPPHAAEGLGKIEVAFVAGKAVEEQDRWMRTGTARDEGDTVQACATALEADRNQRRGMIGISRRIARVRVHSRGSKHIAAVIPLETVAPPR